MYKIGIYCEVQYFIVLVNKGKGRVGGGFVWLSHLQHLLTCWSGDLSMVAEYEKLCLSRSEHWITLNGYPEGKLPCLTVRSPAFVFLLIGVIIVVFMYFVFKRKMCEFSVFGARRYMFSTLLALWYWWAKNAICFFFYTQDINLPITSLYRCDHEYRYLFST